MAASPSGSRTERDPASRAERGQGSTAELLEQLQTDVARVVESTLRERTISESPHQKTGNAYQTVRLGDKVLAGFRAIRPNLLAGFEVEGRSVCDLGSNLGEIARDLRRAGAVRVDAYEYEDFFTQLARYITAFNGLSNVNHLQADVAREGFLQTTYELGVGLSSFSFMQRNLDYICSRVTDQLLLETHEIRDESWADRYVRPITAHFPHWCCFGSVTHGGPKSQKRRLWLAFSKTDMRQFYGRRADDLTLDGEGVITADLSRSSISALNGAPLLFAHQEAPLSDDAVSSYRERLEAYDDEFRQGEAVPLALSGEPYWLALLSGVSDFERDGHLSERNVYLTWLKRGIEAGVVDPGLRPFLAEEGKLQHKASLRLAALGRALREQDTSHFGGLPIAFNATPFHPSLGGLNLKRLAVSGSDEDVCVPNINGHHRMFILKLLGIDECPMMTIWDPRMLAGPNSPRTLRAVENYEQRIYQYLAGVAVDAPALAST